MADIVHRIDVATGADALYPLVSTARGFQAWWAEDVVEKPDGLVELGFFDRATTYRLRPLEREAGHRAVWRCETGDEWNGTCLSFDLDSGGGATHLRFMHAGWKNATEYFERCNTTWGTLMYRLKADAEGKNPGPLFRKSSLAY